MVAPVSRTRYDARMGIDWAAFSWEAFAALATGAGAVAGATWVGLRQVGISRRQTEILDRQVELEEAKLRAEMFDRRLQTYEAAADFLLNLGRQPNEDDGQELRISRFAQKLRESQFLFESRVYEGLSEIWEAGNQQRTDRAISIGNHADDMPYDRQLSQRIQDRTVWSLKRLNSLHELFEDDLNIMQIKPVN
jgi:hypothetical protein